MSRCRRGVWGAEKLVGKLNDFIAKVKAYFDGLTTNTKAEAALLKEMRDGGLHYLERIVEAYDKAATAAVENYQGAEARSEGKAQMDQMEIREAFADEIEQWVKDGKPEGVRFTLGSTGPVLQGLGAIESDIYMEGDKISTILRDHPEMTLAEIKKIPQILEDPALVLKSKGTNARGRNTRLVVFGSAKASNGKPVMSVLDLRPRERGFVLEDMQKVNSAYVKKNPGNFLTSSEVLYADKKRTIPLLRSSGLTIASRQLLRNGYIGSITYAGQNVNIKGLPFSFVVRGGDVQFSIRDSEGRSLTEAQQDYFKDSKVRDAEGRLKVVYHGSGAVFTKFSADFMSQNGSSEGQGFYFTDYKPMAEGYSKKGGQLLEGYLDMKKPLSDSEVTLTSAEVRKIIKAVDPTGDDLVLNYDSKGGMGYPSRAWYNRAVEDTLRATMSTSDSDSEILAELANGMGNPGAVLKAAREVLGYDGYIVEDKYENATVYVAFDSSQFKNLDNQSPTADPDIRYSIREIAGTVMPVLDTQKDTRNYSVAEAYLKTLVDTEHPFSTILMDAQPVYIGRDLPGEYRSSEYTKTLRKAIRDVKMQAATNLDEMLLLAENGEWHENIKEKHKVDAKNGWYRYSTQFAVPVLDIKKSVDHYTVYSGTLLIRNDADGNSYLYDLLDIKKEKVISSASFSARGHSEVFEPKPSQTQYTQNQTESQAQIRSSTLSDRDVLRIAAQMAKNSESRSLTDADRSAPLNFGYHEAKHLIQSCFIQIETVSVLQCVLPCFLFRISIFDHECRLTRKRIDPEKRSICGNEKFFPAKINRAVFCREGSFHFG